MSGNSSNEGYSVENKHFRKGESSPQNSRVGIEVSEDLRDNFDRVSPEMLDALRAKVDPNLIQAATPEELANERQEKKEFANLATKFMIQGGIMTFMKDGEEVMIAKVEYLPSLGELHIVDTSGKEIENGGTINFLPLVRPHANQNVSPEVPQKITAAGLLNTFQSIDWPDIVYDVPSSSGRVSLLQPHEIFLGKFLTAAGQFLKQGGRIFVTTHTKRTPVKTAVLGIRFSGASFVYYSDKECTQEIKNGKNMTFENHQE